MRVVTDRLACVSAHLDSATATQVISGNELAGHHNKYGAIWRDKEKKRKTRDDWSAVPKKFYSNYKSNMIRDAHSVN